VTSYSATGICIAKNRR